jgi:hypothetical protein
MSAAPCFADLLGRLDEADVDEIHIHASRRAIKASMEALRKAPDVKPAHLKPFKR